MGLIGALACTAVGMTAIGPQSGGVVAAGQALGITAVSGV